MDFGLSEEQDLLQQSLRGYLGERVGLAAVRAVVEGESGHSRELIAGLAEQGVTGVMVAPEYGGSGLGLLDAAVVAEELGRAAAPISFHSGAVMAPLAIAALGGDAQKSRWLAAVAAGSSVVSVAFAPGFSAGGVWDDSVAYVPDATSADAFVLFVGTGAGAAAYLIPADEPGVSAAQLQAVDLTRRLGVLRFSSFEAEAAMRLAGGDAAQTASRVLQAGRVALAADALGAAERGLEAAVEYAKTRKQFGRVIASFQAVKHMCAETFAEVEPLRALLWYAAFAWDERYEDAHATAMLLKAYAGEAATQATTTCTQVFGGMGFTWECDMHLWFKRAGYDRQVLGGPTALRAEAAAIRLVAAPHATQRR